MSPAKGISVNLLDLFNDPKNLTFCAYKELGLMCFDGSELFLVSVLPPNNQQSTPVFVKTSTIELEERPPVIDQITEIQSSPNGRFVALVSERCVFVVELSIDFWNSRSLFASVCLENLRKSYTAKCEILNVSTLLGKRFHRIRKFVWLPDSKMDTSDFSTNILGILYSNSVVKIYDLVASKSAPIALANFQNALYEEEADDSFRSSDGKHLGLFSEIVSFDFGPLLSYKNHTYFSVFAVDSDGEVYYNVCGTQADRHINPIGPLNFEGIDAGNKSFYLNSSEIHFVNHGVSTDLPVFAFCSERGELFHAVLYLDAPQERLFESNRNVYRLSIMDSLQIEDWPARNLNVALRSDPEMPGEFFVITTTEVYLISPLNWIYSLSQYMSDPNPESSNFPVSEVRHLFKLMGAGSETTTTIVAIASLRIETESNETSKLSLLTVLDTTPRLSANFIQRRLNVVAGAPKPGQPTDLPKTANARLNIKAPILSSLPKISTADLDHHKRVKIITNVLRTIDDQSKQFQPCVADARQKTERMIQRYELMDQCYEKFCDHIANIFEQIHKYKKELALLREKLSPLESRYNTIIDLVQSKVFTPTEKEDEAALNLKKTLKDCNHIVNSIRDLNNKMATRRTKCRIRPFQVSASGQKFMLTKNAVESAELNEHIDQLWKDIHSLNF